MNDRSMRYVSEYLRNSTLEHPGKQIVRTVLDCFEARAPSGGRHRCLLYDPLGMNFTEFLKLLPQHIFTKELLQRSLQLVLIGLAYLHECHVVHTGRFYRRLFYRVKLTIAKIYHPTIFCRE
jgi:hypothetical protein